MTLSDTAMALLSKAARREDRLVEPPAKLPVAARNAVFRSLIKQGLLAEVPALREAIDMAWRRDDEAAYVSARITDAGLRALNLDLPETAACTVGQAGKPMNAATDGREAADAASQAPDDTIETADVAKSAANAAGGQRELPSDTAAAPKADMRRSNRIAALQTAAEMLLAAWDGTASREANVVAALEAPIASLRAALANHRVPWAAGAAPQASRVSSENTKQAQVLALLRRDEGASGPALIEATGWAPHTVRGFLAGLTRKGIAVTVLERVRQVGPDKTGTKGSYTVYRITEVA